MSANRPLETDALLSARLSTNPVLILALCGILLLMAICHLALNIIYSTQHHIITAHLESTLNAVTDQIEAWQTRNIGTLQVLQQTERGRQLLTTILQSPGPDLELNREMQRWLNPILAPVGYEGFSVINMQRHLVATNSVGYLNHQVDQPAAIEVLDRALLHQPSLSRPVHFAKPLVSLSGELQPNALRQIICQLVEYDQQPLGYFCLRLDPYKHFFPFFASGRSGDTGEVYGIDPAGRIVTPSRFESTPLVPDTQHALTQQVLEARVPVNHQAGPVTALAKRLITTHEPGLSRLSPSAGGGRRALDREHQHGHRGGAGSG